MSAVLLGIPAYAQQNTYSEVQLGKIRYAQKVLKEATEKKDTLQLAEAYYLFGKIEYTAGNYLTAQKWFMRSLRIQEKYGDSFKLGRLYLRLQDNEMAQGHYQESFKYLKIASDIFKRIKSDTGLARTYGWMATLYANNGIYKYATAPIAEIKPNHDSALYYYNKTREYFIKLKDTLGLAEFNRNIGGFYENRGDPKAIEYYKESLDVFEKKDKKSETASSYIVLASAYLTFKQPKEAYKMLVNAQRIYDTHLNNEYITQGHLALVKARYYEATGNWKEVVKYLKQKHELDKNDLLADYKGAVSRLNIEFETQKKEAQLKQQQHDLQIQAENARTQRLTLITLAMLLLITIGLSLVFFNLSRKNQRISKRNEVLVNEQNHRVKNNLQVVSSLLHLQSKRLTDTNARSAVEESMLRIETMAILHRKLYDQDELAMVNLPEYIMDLCEEVLKTFNCYNLSPTYNLGQIKLSADQAMPIGLIITELITNACKYAFTNTANPELSISTYLEHKYLTLVVKDNGPGFEPVKQDTKPKTFGMRLIQIQVSQLYGTYKFENVAGSIFTLKFKPLFP